MKKILLAVALVILFISSCSGQRVPKAKPLEERNSQLDERNPQVNNSQPNGITVKNRTNGDIPFVVHYGKIDVRTTDDYEGAVTSGSSSPIRLNKDCILATPEGNFQLKKDHNYELFFNGQAKLNVRIVNGQ